MKDGNTEAKAALVRRFLGLGLISGALVMSPGCGGDTQVGTDSSTHWLQRCLVDTECGQLSCLYGVCTRACQAASECASLASAALCQSLSSGSDATAATAVCTASCTTSGDCRAIASGLVCTTDGSCQLDPNAGQGGAVGTTQGSFGGNAAGGSRSTAGGTPESSGVGGKAASVGGAQGQGGASNESGSGGRSAGTNAGGSANLGDSSNLGGSTISGGSAAIGGEAGAAGSSGAIGDRLVLDPATLTFFDLPIDSLRNAVAGYDAAHRTCATVIWDWSTSGARCNDATSWSNPYVVLVTDTEPPCEAWAYGGNIETTSWTGCVDFSFGAVGFNLVDVEVAVQGTSFTGTIVAQKRPAGSVTFGFEYLSDVPESVYVQTSGGSGLPTWLRVMKDGQTLGIFDDCGVPKCGSDGGVCGVALHQARSITRGTAEGGVYGTIYASWDGRIRSVDQTGQCMVDAPAAPGNYQIEICYGLSTVDGAGADVESPTCVVRDFTYPNERVVVTVDERG